MSFLLPIFSNSHISMRDKLNDLKKTIELYYIDVLNRDKTYSLNETSYKIIINKVFILDMYTNLEFYTKNLIKLVYKNYKNSIIDPTFLSNFFIKVIDRPYIRDCISKDIIKHPFNDKGLDFFEIDFEKAFTFSNSMDLDEFHKLLKNLNLKNDDLKDFITNDPILKTHIGTLRELGVPIVQELEESKESEKLSDIEKYIKNISLCRHHYAHGSNELLELYNENQMIEYVLFFISFLDLLTKYISDKVSSSLVKHYTNIKKCKKIPIEEIRYENKPTKEKYDSRGIINISEPISFDNKLIFIGKEKPKKDQKKNQKEISEEISLINIRLDAEQIEEVDTGKHIKINEMRNGKYSIPFSTSIKIEKRKKYHLYLLTHEDREYKIIFK